MEIKTFSFDIKEVSEDGIIEGYGSTFGGQPDSYGDIIVEGAFKESISRGGRNGTGVPMLWQHDFHEPIGKYTELVENKKGLKITGQLTLAVQRAKEAHALAKDRVIDAFSIGWDIARDKKGNPQEGSYEIDAKKGVRYLKKIELWEISLVTFPANTSAVITRVKNVFETVTNERDLEKGLREVGLSHSASKYIIANLDKEKAFGRKNYSKELLSVAEALSLNKSNELLSAVQKYL